MPKWTSNKLALANRAKKNEEKGRLIADASVPYHVVLKRFPFQEDWYKAFKRSPLFGGDGPSVFALPWSRRSGKTLSVWQAVIESCMTYKNYNVLVTHETFEACRQQFLRSTWTPSTPEDPGCFLGLIPKGVFPDMDELPAGQKWQASCVNYNEGVISFPSGSSIILKGAKNPKVRGRDINMWVADEYAFYENHGDVKGKILPMLTKRDYAKYDPSLGAAPPSGIIIYTSTGNGMNDYANIALGTDEEMQKRGVWCRILPYNHPELVNNDGKPVVTEEYLDEKRAAGLTEDIIRREYLITFESAVYGSVFGDQMELMVKQGHITDVLHYNNDIKINTGWDIGYGGRSLTVVLLAQEHKGVHHFIREFVYHDKTSLGRVHADLDEYIRGLGTETIPARWGMHYLPWDAARDNNHTLGDNTQSVEYLLGVLGFQDLYITKRKGDKKKAPLFIRNWLPNYVLVSRSGCPGLVAALAGYSYKADSRGVFSQMPDTSSVHSHYIDALDSYLTGHQELHGQNMMELAQKGLRQAEYDPYANMTRIERLLIGGDAIPKGGALAMKQLRRLYRNNNLKGRHGRLATRANRNRWMRK